MKTYLRSKAHILSDIPNSPSNILNYSTGSGWDDRHVSGVDGSLLKLRRNTDQSHLAPVYSRPTASMTETTGATWLLGAFLPGFVEAEALQHVGEPDLEGKGRHNAVIAGISGTQTVSTSCFTVTAN